MEAANEKKRSASAGQSIVTKIIENESKKTKHVVSEGEDSEAEEIAVNTTKRTEEEYLRPLANRHPRVGSDFQADIPN